MIVSVQPSAINAQPPIVNVQRIVVTARHAISSASLSAIKVEPLALRAEATSALGL
jgi:hypothetical protein